MVTVPPKSFIPHYVQCNLEVNLACSQICCEFGTCTLLDRRLYITCPPPLPSLLSPSSARKRTNERLGLLLLGGGKAVAEIPSMSSSPKPKPAMPTKSHMLVRSFVREGEYLRA